jgi:murein DD-endopeptidase MepM/ murein hydrolase activator NlpD
MIPPVRPYRGTRGLDAWGAGGFGAPRGDHDHKGLDFIAHPGDEVVAPFDGVIERLGIAYPDSDLGVLVLAGQEGRTKLLYLRPMRKVGEVIERGIFIGVVQDVASYHEAKNKDLGHMTNHLHMELYVNGDLVDPALHLEI